MSDFILLKWGSIKGYELTKNWGDKKVQSAVEKYNNSGDVNMSAMMQRDTDVQKEALCDLIDAVKKCKIQNDWDGEYYTKKQAKEYIMNYGKD